MLWSQRTTSSKKALSLLVALTFLSSCALPVDRRLPEEQRQTLGRLGVATAQFFPAIDLGITRSKGHGAARGAIKGAGGVLYGGLQSGDGFGFLLSVLLVPVFATGGAVYGAIASDSSTEVHKSVDSLDAVLYAKELQLTLTEKLLDHTAWQSSQQFDRIDLSGAEIDGEWPDFRGEIDLDTVLEVGIREIRLHDEGLRNAKVNLQTTCFARLVKVTDGSVIFDREYSHRSINRDLNDWAENQGLLLKNEIMAALDVAAAGIVDDLFLVVAFSADELKSLAATKPLPEFCFFCPGAMETQPTLQPTLCWVPFPSPLDLSGPNGERLSRVDQVVYDLRIWSLAGENFYAQHDITSNCNYVEAPLESCTMYVWQVRARFLDGGIRAATPWKSDKNSRFRTACH